VCMTHFGPINPSGLDTTEDDHKSGEDSDGDGDRGRMHAGVVVSLRKCWLRCI
jgi:hypothetical protein